MAGGSGSRGGPLSVGPGSLWKLDVEAAFTSIFIKRQRRSIVAETSSPCLELAEVNRTKRAALQDIWVRSFEVFLKRYSSCTDKP